MFDRPGIYAVLAGVILLLTVLSFNAEAGLFDDISRKVKNAASEAVKDMADSNSIPNPVSDQGGKQSSGMQAGDTVSAARSKGVPHSSGYPPGLMFSTVLNGVLLDYKTGKLYLDKIQAVFLPTPTVKSNSIYAYDPTNGGGLVWAELKDESGGRAAKFEFTGQDIKDPFWLLSTARCNECEPGNRTRPLLPGKYTLDFYVEGDHFYHFPFSIDTLKPDNPFDGGNFYFINGDWEEWGYLYYSEARPDQNLTWKVWLRNKAVEPRGIDAKIDVTLYRGGKPLAKSSPATHNINPGWIRFEFGLTDPMRGTSGGRYFKAGDLLAKDGDYTLKMVINGKEYGTWPFAVQGGKLQYSGRTVRGKADTLTFIEGGKDAWWYKMK